jgi:hypothetical protein
MDVNAGADEDGATEESQDTSECGVVSGSVDGGSRMRPTGLDDDSILSLFNGKRKYTRKIDYLVDELIWKAAKTLDVNSNSSSSSDGSRSRYSAELCDCGAWLPNSVGPHPQTDMRLLSSTASSASRASGEHSGGTSSVPQMAIIPYEIESGTSPGNVVTLNPVPVPVPVSAPALPSASVSHVDTVSMRDADDNVDAGAGAGEHSSPGEHCRLSGDLTHCDWPIEEV